MSISKRIAIFCGISVVVNVFLWSTAFSHWRDSARLVGEGIRVEGRVVALEPLKHNSVTYEYSVERQISSARSSVSFGGLPPLAKLKIGGKIPVSYWPGDPSVSLPGDPVEPYESWSGLLFLVAPLFGVVVVAWWSGRLISKPLLRR